MDLLRVLKDILRGKTEQEEALRVSLKNSVIMKSVIHTKIATLICGYYKIDNSWDGYEHIESIVKKVKKLYESGEIFLEHHPEVRSRTVKGFVSSNLYPERWWRQVGDLDIFLPLEQASILHNEMISNGFSEIAGYMDRRVPTPDNRRKAMMYLLQHSHELPKLENNNGLVIDTNFRAIYRGNPQFRNIFSTDSIEHFFYENWQEFLTSPSEYPSNDMTFFFITLHHSAEIMLFDFQDKRDVSTDICLGKLFDILLFIKKNLVSADNIREMLNKSESHALFSYLFWIVDQLFDDQDWRDFGKELNISETQYKNVFFSRQGDMRRWDVMPSSRVYSINVIDNSSIFNG
ncbi:nucleotidyltransferase family protein [Dickeya dianthicola]|uniref:nucleotidyltransferase family protein n=1 Tax=Dickeya dianthicola TaxID=204039 RepID=UPI00186670C0|nr:nucleotidyltransferase family protein [Dickeya dianthicola]QOL13599.1 nucleotidyltransferase family protein [Dickeya dianthicola]